LTLVLNRFIEITGDLFDKCENVEKDVASPTECNTNSNVTRNNTSDVVNEFITTPNRQDAVKISNDIDIQSDEFKAKIITFDISPHQLDPVLSLPPHASPSALCKFITDIPPCDGSHLSPTSFADGLGGWEVFFELSMKAMALLFDHLEALNDANKPDSGMPPSLLLYFSILISLLDDLKPDFKYVFPVSPVVRTEVLGLVQHLKHLRDILDLMVRSVTEAIDEAEIDRLSEEITIPPFWYNYGDGLLLLQLVIETAKAATFRTSRSREHEAGESALSQLFSVGYQSVLHLGKSMIGATSANDFVELHRSSSVATLKLFFNLPSDPIVSKFTNFMLPAIHTSITISLPMFEPNSNSHAPTKQVSCQLLYPSQLPLELIDKLNHPAQSPTSQGTNSKSPPLELDVVLHFHGGMLFCVGFYFSLVFIVLFFMSPFSCIGGFVAGNPQFHESYTRDWSIEANALILSVDYSLAPDAKFPLALEECFYVYRWLVERNDWNITPRFVNFCFFCNWYFVMRLHFFFYFFFHFIDIWLCFILSITQHVGKLFLLEIPLVAI
jgi:hypothetical protein